MGNEYFKEYYRKNKVRLDAKSAKWCKDNKDARNRIQRRYQHKIKSKIFDLLGNKCIKCGYSGLALQIDHTNDNGKKEPSRNSVRRGGCCIMYYKRILDVILSGSKDYQLLCANCNWEKELMRRHNK